MIPLKYSPPEPETEPLANHWHKGQSPTNCSNPVVKDLRNISVWQVGGFGRKQCATYFHHPKLIDTPQPKDLQPLEVGSKQFWYVLIQSNSESLNLGTPCVCMLVADGTSNWEPSGESDGIKVLNLAVRTSSDAPTDSCWPSIWCHLCVQFTSLQTMNQKTVQSQNLLNLAWTIFFDFQNLLLRYRKHIPNRKTTHWQKHFISICFIFQLDQPPRWEAVCLLRLDLAKKKTVWSPFFNSTNHYSDILITN